jgi:hypothetical protein
MINKKNYKIKLILSVLLLFGLLIFSNFINAQQNYDVVDIDVSNYNYEPAPIIPGDDFTLWIQLTNNSNVIAENIDYLLELDYPFSLADYGKLDGTISSIAPYQTKILKYNLKSDFLANLDSYTIKFKYKRSGINVYNIKEYVIDSTSQNVILDVVSSNTDKINIGKSSKIIFNLKNLSLQNAKDIFVTLDNSSDSKINVLNLSTIYIDKLNALEEVSIEYNVLADKTLESKSYSLPITIVYSDSIGNHTISRTIGLEIVDNPNMSINVVNLGNNYKLITNTIQNIELEIYNTGNIDAESVYIEANGKFLKNSIRYFIGSIEKDNYDSVDLKLNVKDIDSGFYNLELVVNYKDGDLVSQNIIKNVQVEIINDSNKSNSFVTFLLIVGYIILIIFSLSFLIIIIRWLVKVLVIPALKVLNISKNKKNKN